MARKGYSLGSLTDYVNTKFNISGGEITGSMNVQGILNEKGQRVYSPNNKPTAGDVSALSTSGGTMNGQIVFSSSTQQFQAPFFGASDVDGLCVLTQGRWSYTSNVSSTAPNNMPAGSNANGILTFNTHQGDFYHQLGLSSNSRLYHRHNKGAWATIYTSAAKPTPNELGAVNKAGDTMTGQLIAPSFKAGTKIVMGAGGNDVFLNNTVSNKYLQLGDDGIIRYDSKELMQVKGDGYVVGNNNTNYPRLQLKGSDNLMYELHVPGKYASGLVLNYGNGNFEFWDTNGGGGWLRTLGYWSRANGELYGGANANFNDVYIRSDARLKTDLKPLSGALEKVCSLQGYTYTKHKSLKDDTVLGVEAGILAQDLEEILPEAVNTAEDTQKTISNSGVNALLVEALKELRAEVAELRAELVELKGGK